MSKKSYQKNDIKKQCQKNRIKNNSAKRTDAVFRKKHYSENIYVFTTDILQK